MLEEIGTYRRQLAAIDRVCRGCTSDYESGGQEFESLRARQNANGFRYKSDPGDIAMQNIIFCMASAWLRSNLLLSGENCETVSAILFQAETAMRALQWRMHLSHRSEHCGANGSNFSWPIRRFRILLPQQNFFSENSIPRACGAVLRWRFHVAPYCKNFSSNFKGRN
jgi:hypothetical protein